LGRLTQTATPHIDAVYALVSLLAKQLGETHGRLSLPTSPTFSDQSKSVQMA